MSAPVLRSVHQAQRLSFRGCFGFVLECASYSYWLHYVLSTVIGSLLTRDTVSNVASGETAILYQLVFKNTFGFPIPKGPVASKVLASTSRYELYSTVFRFVIRNSVCRISSRRTLLLQEHFETLRLLCLPLPLIRPLRHRSGTVISTFDDESSAHGCVLRAPVIIVVCADCLPYEKRHELRFCTMPLRINT